MNKPIGELTKDELDAVLIHLQEVEASDKKCRVALRAIIEEAAKHATDEEPWGWAWIHIVVTAKEALGLPTR